MDYSRLVEEVAELVDSGVSHFDACEEIGKRHGLNPEQRYNLDAQCEDTFCRKDDLTV